MAIFPVNQNRQLFVVEKTATTPANAGEVAVKTTADKKQVYLSYYGKGGLIRTDLIDIDKVEYARMTKAAEMQHKLKVVSVTLDGEVNGGAPISGQDYILRIFFKQYIGAGDCYQEAKYGAVHATANMTAATFYNKMLASLYSNFSKEVAPLVKFYGDAKLTVEVAGAKYINGVYTAVDSSGAAIEAEGIFIEEAEQPWRLGVMKQVPVLFDAIPTTVTYNGDEVIWGAVEELSALNTVGNGKITADLEFFCMGERGDQYRLMNWPNNITTEYMVDSTKEYDYIDIHYAYVGDGVSVQKSEKDLTLVGVSGKLADVATALTNAGITIDNK